MQLSKTVLTFLRSAIEQKIITYARNRISEYWVIDLKNNKLIVHTEIQNSRYSKITEYLSGKIVSQVFPDIEIDIKKLLLY